jgi:hypothetical protein
LREADDGLPQVSEYTIRKVMLKAGYTWQHSRSSCQTGQVERQRKAGNVVVTDPNAEEKKLIEQAYQVGEVLGLRVWCEDEAGPYQTKPYAGASWQPQAHPTQQPHEYLREGTVKTMTLFHPTDGCVRLKGGERTTNTVVHAWLKTQLLAILEKLTQPTQRPAHLERVLWKHWRADLQCTVTLPRQLPPLRLLLVMDNLVEHKNPAWLLWCFAHGILPLYTP